MSCSAAPVPPAGRRCPRPTSILPNGSGTGGVSGHALVRRPLRRGDACPGSDGGRQLARFRSDPGGRWGRRPLPVLLPQFAGPRQHGLDDGLPAPSHIGPHLPRVTINPRLLEAAPVLVVTWGAGKAEALGHVFGETRDDRRWPVQRRAGRAASGSWTRPRRRRYRRSCAGK